MGTIPARERDTRADIDGLRTIAVLSVISFHLDPAFLRAGFLGVDIFFVISGFLIGRQILASLHADRFDFGDFYERRARRILPAMLIMVLFVHGATFLLFLENDLVDYAKSALATPYTCRISTLCLQSDTSINRKY